MIGEYPLQEGSGNSHPDFSENRDTFKRYRKHKYKVLLITRDLKNWKYFFQISQLGDENLNIHRSGKVCG